MDIYKLSDEIPEEKFRRRASRGRKAEGGHGPETVFDEKNSDYSITDIKQAVKNENRVNIFVNGKYSFSLDIAQVVDLGIKKGLIITEAQLADYKKASEFGKAYQRALEWVLTRPRSESEVKDHIIRKLKKSSSDALFRARCYGDQSLGPLPVGRGGSSEDFVELSEKIISRLASRGYIDDEKFARYYVENRFVKKGISMKRLKVELMKKGVAREIIERVLDNSERNDEEEIKKIIAKKRARYDDEKLIAYLCRQGFQYDLVKSLVEESGEITRH
jgi:regulatory protein